MGPFIYQSRKMGQSYTVSLEKGGLIIVYLASLKKVAIRAAHVTIVSGVILNYTYCVSACEPSFKKS